MEEKKIKYPFKAFVKNILIGIIMILSIFCAMPIIENAVNKVGSNGNGDEVQAEGTTATVKVYGYDDNGYSQSELENKKWGWSSTLVYKYFGNNCIYYTTDMNATSVNKKDYALGSSHSTIEVGEGKQIKFVPETTWGDPEFNVVGIFEGSYLSGATLITTSDRATLYPGHTYIVLVAKFGHGLSFDLQNTKLNVNGITYASQFVDTKNRDYPVMKFPRYATFTTGSFNGYEVSLVSKNNTFPNGSYYCYIISGVLKLYKSDMSLYTVISLSSTNYTTTSDSDDGRQCIVYLDEIWNASSTSQVRWENDKITYNIYNATDLQKFANEVNLGALSEVKNYYKVNYRAVLQNNISSYNGDPIGINEGTGVFQGEFDGNGNTITSATINPTLSTTLCYTLNSGGARGYSYYSGRYTNVSNFGFFININSSAVVKNFKIGTLSAAEHLYTYDESWTYYNGALNSHSLSNVVNSTTLGLSADSSIGGVCAYNNGGKIENVEIVSLSLTLGQVVSSGAMYGSVVGKMNGGSISQCKIGNASITIERLENENTKTDYNIGGLVGYAAQNAKIQNSSIETYSVSGDSWQKHDEYNFYAGGLVGYLENSTLSNCHVNGGTQNYTGIYFTNTIAIGGLVGYSSNSTLTNNSSKNEIKIGQMEGGGVNANYDHGCVGGLVGVAQKTTISECNYQNAKLVFKSGVTSINVELLGWNGSYAVVFGGMIGWVQDGNVKVNNSFVYIPQGVDSTLNADIYIMGGYVGYSDYDVIFTNSYSIIGGTCLARRYESFKVSSAGVCNASPFIGYGSGEFNGTNCYRKNTVSAAGYGSKYALANSDFNTVFQSLHTIDNNGQDKITQIGNAKQYNKTFSVNNKTYTENVIVPIYGYNKNIQYQWNTSSSSAPFLLGKGEYTSYINLMIDCTKAGNTGMNAVNYGSESNYTGEGFVYSVNNSVKYVYGAAVLKSNGGVASYTLPLIKNGEASCVYYSLYPDGRDENGVISIFAYPGDKVSDNPICRYEDFKKNITVSNGRQDNFTIYPIFKDFKMIYSPTKLKVSLDAVSSKNNNVATVYTGTKNGVSYSVYERKLTGENVNGIYIYEYSIEVQDSNAQFTVDLIKNILSVDYNNAMIQQSTDINFVINANSLNSVLTKDNLNFTLSYFNVGPDNVQNKYANDAESLENVQILYCHLFKNANFNYGIFVKNEEGELVKINGSYAAGYESSTNLGSIPQFYGNIKNNETGAVIYADFSGIEKVDGFGNLTFIDENDGQNKIAYTSMGVLSKANLQAKIGEIDGTEYYKLGIYNETNKNGGTVFSQDEYSSGYYMLYREPGIIIHYHSTEEKESSEISDRIEYVQGKTTIDVDIKDYYQAFDNHRYDFVGWNLTINFISADGYKNDNSYGMIPTGTESTKTIFVHPYSLKTFYIPESLIRNLKNIDLHLYPVFVTKNGETFDCFKNSTYQPKALVYSSAERLSYYEVNSVEDLIYCAYMVNYGGDQNLNIKLTKSINIEGVKNFKPIGFDEDIPFMGNFDGGSYTISNLSIEGEYYPQSLALCVHTANGTYDETLISWKSKALADNFGGNTLAKSVVLVGLFGKVANSNSSTVVKLKNVNLINVKYNVLTCGFDYYEYNKMGDRIFSYIGGIAAYAQRTQVSNVLIQGNLFNNASFPGTIYVGGICGFIDGTSSYKSSILECVSSFGATLNQYNSNTGPYGRHYVGSMVGQIGSYADISNCFDRCSKDDLKNLIESESEDIKYLYIWYYKNATIYKYKYGIVGNFADYQKVVIKSGFSSFIGYKWALTNNFSHIYTTLDRTNIIDYSDLSQIELPKNSDVIDPNISAYDIYRILEVVRNKNDYGEFEVSETKYETCESNISQSGKDYYRGVTKTTTTINGGLSNWVVVGSPWAFDANINGGYPYLKNTGMSYVNYSIDTSKFILTPEDEARFYDFIYSELYSKDNSKLDEKLIKRDGEKLIITKQYFVLDITSYIIDSAGLDNSSLGGQDNQNLANKRVSEFYNFFENELSELKLSAYKYSASELVNIRTIFNELEGYEFFEFNSLTDYEGFFDTNEDFLVSCFGYNNSTYEKKYNATKIVDLILNNSTSDIEVTFNAKPIRVKYILELGGERYEIEDETQVNFADNYALKELNIASLSEEIQNKLIGKEILGYKIYLPEKQTDLNLESDGDSNKLVYIGDYPYTSSDHQSETQKIYAVGTEFLISLIDSLSTDDTYQLHLIVDDDCLRNIKFKLNFFDENKNPINAFIYEGPENIYTVDAENGNINYFIKYYNDVLKGEFGEEIINLFPSYYKTGHDFGGWGYYQYNDTSKTLMTFYNGNDINMPDIRISPYFAVKQEFEDEKIYCLDLYPILSKKTFDMRYFDGFYDVQNPEFITYHSPNPVYQGDTTLYNHEELSEYKAYNRHSGYKLSGFVFTSTTENAIKALTEVDANVVINSIYNMIYSGEISGNVIDFEINKDNLVTACIKVINYMLQNNKTFKYFFPMNIDLVCIYERLSFAVKVELTNSDNVDMRYTVVDDITKQTSSLKSLEFNQVVEEGVTKQVAYIYVSYNDIVNIYTNLYNGTRINKITHSSDRQDLYSFTNYGTSSENYTKNILPNLTKLQVGSINGLDFDGIKENLTYYYDIEDLAAGATELTKIGSYYEISSEEDLVEYVKNIREKEYDNVILTKDLNVTGVKLNLNLIPDNYVFDGKGHTINGFTSFGIDFSCLDYNLPQKSGEISFVYANCGTIKNLNFDNICVNVQYAKTQTFGIIENNMGKIENVNVLGGNVILNNHIAPDQETFSCAIFVGFVGENYIEGKIENVYCNLNIILSGEAVGYVGMIAGANSGNINNVVSLGAIDISQQTASGHSVVSGVVGLYHSGLISNVIIDENLYINADNKASVIGFDASENGRSVSNVSNVADYTELAFVLDTNYMVVEIESDNVQKTKNLSNEELFALLNGGFESSNFVLAYDENANLRFVIPNLNNQIISITINNACQNKKISFVEKINGCSALKESNNINISKITFFSDLCNNFIFNSDEFEEICSSSYYNLSILKETSNVTNLFDIKYKLNSSNSKTGNFVEVYSSRVPKADEIEYTFTPKECDDLNFKLEFTNTSNFSDEEKIKIKDSIKVFINDNEYNLYFDDNNYATIVDDDRNVITIKYFDEIKYNFDFPSFAFFSVNNGLKVNNNIVEDSKGKQNFEYVYTCEKSNTFIIANVDRRITTIKFDLNKDSLTDEVEKEKISFNEQAIQKIFIDNGINAVINNEGQLEIEVTPTFENGDVVYYLPDLIKIVDEQTYIVFDYTDEYGENCNGINYLLYGFVNKEENSYYYDKNFGKYRLTFSKPMILYADYQKVKYEVVVDNLNNSCHFTDYNGYSNVSGKAVKTTYFSDSIALPTIAKNSYNECYDFVGYKLDDGTEQGIMISSAELNLIGENNVITHILNLGYETLNAKYTKYKEQGEFKIVLYPVFTEKVYTLIFKDGQNQDEYDAYLNYLEPTSDHSHYDEIAINLTISEILNGNFVLPVGNKEHHSFVGFKIEGDETNNVVISFVDDLFYLDKDILIGNKTFIAVYEIDKVQVIIDALDINLNKLQDFEVSNFNDVLIKAISYEINPENQIVFIVNYNTTNFVLPTIVLSDENYKFADYIIENETYTTSYKFTQDVTINITCNYKVKFITKTGEINSSYNLFRTNSTFKRDEDLNYSFYANFNATIELPKTSEVSRTGFILSGFKIDGESLSFNESIASTSVVTIPTLIEFVYTGETYTLSLDSSAYSASLPNSLISEYIESYDLISDYHAEIKVINGTEIAKIKSALPKLEAQGYTFDGYEFDEAGTVITRNGTITPRFTRNEYEIVVFDADGTRINSVRKYYGDTIEDTFYQNIEAYATTKAEQNNAVYKGLSLDRKYFSEFNKPSLMPNLENEYSTTTQSGNLFSVYVYCFYISNIVVTITANENTKIENENVAGIYDFVGGNVFNASASFKLSANDIISGVQIKLPVPQIKEDSVLEFASFVGYSMNVDGKVIVVDGLGKLLDTFDYASSTIELTQEFEFKDYNFNVTAKYDSVKDDEYFGYIKNSNGFTKIVKFGETISNLPVLNLNNYNFVGYYLSSNDNLLVNSQDIQISDFEGNLLSDYETLSENYFEKVNGEYVLKNICAKFEIKYLDVTIKTENSKLGGVDAIILADGTNLQYSQTQNGFIVKVPSGKDIIISANANTTVASFKNWIVKLDEVDITNVCGIENSLNQATIIKNVQNNLEIIATFNYVNFNITYIVDGQEQDLSPKEYNIDTPQFDLPNFEKFGYNFVGWFLEENFINKIEFINPAHHTNNLTLYGKLENKVVDLNIYSNNIEGYNLHSKVQATFNKTIENLPTITLDGYNFVGFFTGDNATGILIDNSSLSIFTQETNIYAFFEAKLENTLSGEGTQNKPYLIKNAEDFKIFVSLVNYENLGNKNYFKLASNIEISDNFVINSFSANFDGNGYVIYLNNCLSGYNVLTSEGKIVKNLSLFGNNSGSISNLIVVNNQDTVNDLISSYAIYENIENQVHYCLIANKNDGLIENVIVYFNIELTNLDLIESETNSFAEICLNNANVQDYSVINSSLTDKNQNRTYNNALDKHLISKNLQEVNKNANGIYEISSKEELAYVLNLSDSEIKIELKNNIDFKGKVLDKKFENKFIVNGNGYIISNLIVLDKDYVFNDISLTKVAIEGLVNLNLFAQSSVILNANQIENSYIELSLNNSTNLIATNSAQIINSYFIANNSIEFIKVNNANIKNVYVINLSDINQNNAILSNFVKFDTSNIFGADEFIQNAKTDNELNNTQNLWFKDENKIMSDFVLPKLASVGNIVHKLVYDSNVLEITPLHNNIINNNLIITKNVEDVLINLNLIDNQKHLVDILINSESRLDDYNNVLKMFTIKGVNSNYNEIEFITDVNIYNVSIVVNPTGKGNKVKVNEEIGEEITLNVESGIKISDLSITTINGEGYKFVGFDVFDKLGNLVEAEEIFVLQDLKVVAKFEKLISYKLYLNSYENITVLDSKLDDYWTEIDLNVYQIYLTNNEDVTQFLPQISKQDYVFVDYSIIKLDELNFKINVSFVEDYVTVVIDYNSDSGLVSLSSENEYSLTSPELKVVVKDQNDNKKYKVLRGYEIILTIDFNGSYLTKVLIDNVDLFADYSIFEFKEDEINQQFTPSAEISEHNIVVEFSSIIVETKFEFDFENCSIELKNAIIDVATNIVKVKKNSEILFALLIEDSKELDNFVFTNEEGEFTPEFEFIDGIYKYIATQNSTIKINLKDRMINIIISHYDGGSVNLLSEAEKTIIDENTYSFKVLYNDAISLLIETNDGYKPKEISVNGNVVELKSLINLSNIKEDLSISVSFLKLSTWLDLGEENMPIHFALTKFSGTGTENNPYIISNINDFLTLAYNVNVKNVDYTGVYFKASQRDLKLNFARYYFDPINNFNGTILGDNLTLSGIKIYANSGAGLFKTLGANALIKTVNVEGQIEGNNLVASIACENNGTILGCSNKATILNNNNYYNENNITAGICAINNGTISRCYNAGQIEASSKLVAGICAINNGTIDNIYNIGMIIIDNDFVENSVASGICAENSNVIQIGYNSSRIINALSNNKVTIVGTVKNSSGSYQSLYFNKNMLGLDSSDGRTFNELTDIQNEIYQNFDKNIWEFIENALPTLKVCYEYLGTITFTVTFDENLSENEKLVLLELTDGQDQNFGLALKNQNRVYKISNLTKGTYKIRLKSVVGSAVSTENSLEIVLNENTSELVEVKITLTKSKANGYYGYVVI